MLPDPFRFRPEAALPRRTPAERARWQDAPALWGDVPPRGPRKRALAREALS